MFLFVTTQVQLCICAQHSSKEQFPSYVIQSIVKAIYYNFQTFEWSWSYRSLTHRGVLPAPELVRNNTGQQNVNIYRQVKR